MVWSDEDPQRTPRISSEGCDNMQHIHPPASPPQPHLCCCRYRLTSTAKATKAGEEETVAKMWRQEGEGEGEATNDALAWSRLAGRNVSRRHDSPLTHPRCACAALAPIPKPGEALLEEAALIGAAERVGVRLSVVEVVSLRTALGDGERCDGGSHTRDLGRHDSVS